MNEFKFHRKLFVCVHIVSMSNTDVYETHLNGYHRNGTQGQPLLFLIALVFIWETLLHSISYLAQSWPK